MGTQTSDSIRQKPRLTTGEELAAIVQRAQAFTNASGAAIAVNEGNSDEIVCRARSGSSAPDVGTTLRVEGSFTGICIQTGKELRCDDAETDTRVDTAAIRALGIRSMVITPIKNERKVVGVLAVFAPMPHAFTITHVAVLKTMADQVSVLLHNEQKTQNEHKTNTKDEPHVIEAAPVVNHKPVPLPPPVVIKPASPPAPSAVAATAAAPARSNASTAPRMETKPVALAAEIGPPVPFPKKEQNRERKPEPSPAPKASFGTLDAVAGESEGSSAGRFILIGVVAAALLVAGLVWFFLRGHKSSSSPAPAQTALQPQNVQPATPAPTAAAPATVAREPIVVSSVSAPSPSPSSNSKVNVSEKADKKSDSKKKEQPSAPPAPATIALSNGPSKIAQAPPSDQSPDVDPSLAVGGGSSPGIASLARPAQTSAPVMAAQSDLVNAKAIHTVPAVYPELAKARRLSATIVVRATVGKDGKVINPRLVSGPIIFRDAAFDAVKQWLFKPAELNGQPIEQETEIHVNFHPN